MMAPGAPPLVLASGSAARRLLLDAAGLRFTVRPVDLDEAAIKAAARQRGATAADTAVELADAKAAACAAPGAMVIAADQTLDCEGDWLDKPSDAASARAQLRRLRDRTHHLHTAVTVWRDGVPRWGHLAHAELVMRAFSDMLLERYLVLEGDAVLGCVGAYRLEGRGVGLFDRVTGDHDAILGLPVLPLLRHLRQEGVLLA